MAKFRWTKLWTLENSFFLQVNDNSIYIPTLFITELHIPKRYEEYDGEEKTGQRYAESNVRHYIEGLGLYLRGTNGM